MELYIKKLWGKQSNKDNYIGGTEDSLLLIDYFGKQTESKLQLFKILSDIHLDILLKIMAMFTSKKQGYIIPTSTLR